MTPSQAVTLVGVDGCKGGWIAVIETPGNALHARTFQSFAQLRATVGSDAVIAVDMPIGLPDRVAQGGRGPENAIRPLLGQRQSSVFSIPSRSAVETLDYRQACKQALATSQPPRKISKQAFFLFAKIREIDAEITPRNQHLLRESHPELVFWRLNGERPLETAKKIKGAINPVGMEQRRRLLAGGGLPTELLMQAPPKGAAADDFLDACACLMTARRILVGSAVHFPTVPLFDGRGLQIAIWT